MATSSSGFESKLNSNNDVNRIVILEEAAPMDESLFYEIVCPLLEKRTKKIKETIDRGNGTRIVHYTDGSTQQITTISNPKKKDTRTEEEKTAEKVKKEFENSLENFQKSDRYVHARKIYQQGLFVFALMIDYVKNTGPCYTRFIVDTDREEHVAFFHLIDYFVPVVPGGHISIGLEQNTGILSMHMNDRDPDERADTWKEFKN